MKPGQECEISKALLGATQEKPPSLGKAQEVASVLVTGTSAQTGKPSGIN